MSELSKLFSSVLLLGAGFLGASLFGPPDLADRLARRLKPSSGESTSWLEPIADQQPFVDPNIATEPLPPLPAAEPAKDPFDAASSAQWETPALSVSHSTGGDWPALSINSDESALAPGAATSEPAPKEEWPATRPQSEKEAFSQDTVSWPGFEAAEQPPAANSSRIPEREPVTEYRSHVLTDGDTLALLAERYLGDRGKQEELFEANKDRLEDPELLPIGVVLRVPVVYQQRKPAVAGPSLFGPRLDEADAVGNAPGSVSSVGYREKPSPYAERLERRPSRLVPVGDPVEQEDIFQEPTSGPGPGRHSDFSW